MEPLTCNATLPTSCHLNGVCVDPVCKCDFFYSHEDACEASYFATWPLELVAYPVVVLLPFLILFGCQVRDYIIEMHLSRNRTRWILKPFPLSKLFSLLFVFAHLLSLGWWVVNFVYGQTHKEQWLPAATPVLHSITIIIMGIIILSLGVTWFDILEKARNLSNSQSASLHLLKRFGFALIAFASVMMFVFMIVTFVTGSRNFYLARVGIAAISGVMISIPLFIKVYQHRKDWNPENLGENQDLSSIYIRTIYFTLALSSYVAMIVTSAPSFINSKSMVLLSLGVSSFLYFVLATSAFLMLEKQTFNKSFIPALTKSRSRSPPSQGQVKARVRTKVAPKKRE